MANLLLSLLGNEGRNPFSSIIGNPSRLMGAVANLMAPSLFPGSSQARTFLHGSRSREVGHYLPDFSIQGSTEGTPIPRVYGRVRITGQIIWGTHYEEQARGRRKTGGRQYCVNFAVGLCEGPINRIGRIWVDGKLLDQSSINFRCYLGTEDQEADSLILSKQSNGVPAYCGLAYVVFEKFPLNNYSNRIPQFAFEVIRVVDSLESKINAVTLVPGTTEFGYSSKEVQWKSRPGPWFTENRYTTLAGSDFVSSLDELQDLCPNLTTISLGVAWFGDHLRAGRCSIMPRVKTGYKIADTLWVVNGLSRWNAPGVSLHQGRRAYEGTPSDNTVIEAIKEIRRRGLKVLLSPLILMDIPLNNGWVDPYGGEEQARYPWCGLITCGSRSGSPSKEIAEELMAFVGRSTKEQFSRARDTVRYLGSNETNEWRLSRFIYHYAHLAVVAGGVDVFLLSSGLKGLTSAYSEPGTYPFVNELVRLAGDVKSILGSNTKVSYAADWSEWSIHRPDENTVYFHMDPLWSSENVDFIGINNYLPLADWRYGSHLDAVMAGTAHDIKYLAHNAVSGEYYDWYYASDFDRIRQRRSVISDDVYQKPWVFRAKDFKNWWGNNHFNRPNGMEKPLPTAWIPESKPIVFTAVGCPAVDLGANQPNICTNSIHAEYMRPYFSRGARDDLMLRRFAEAVITAWTDNPSLNPVSKVYNEPMIDTECLVLYAWDARTFPEFPVLSDTWSDTAGWSIGSILNGRLGGVSVEALIRSILADNRFHNVSFNAVTGHMDGYVIYGSMSIRAALEPLIAACMVDAHDIGTAIKFSGRCRNPVATLSTDDFVDQRDQPLFEWHRLQESELPANLSLTVSDVLRAFQRTTVTAKRQNTESQRSVNVNIPLIAPIDVTAAMVDIWLQDIWLARETVSFGLAHTWLALEPGDIIDVNFGSDNRISDDGPRHFIKRRLMIERIEDGLFRRISARATDPELHTPIMIAGRKQNSLVPATVATPIIMVVDVVRGASNNEAHKPLIATSAVPWSGSLSIFMSKSGVNWIEMGSLHGNAAIGETLSVFPDAPAGIWDVVSTLTVKLYSGILSSVSANDVLEGANTAAIQYSSGDWEVFQFQTATPVGDGKWELSKFLRKKFGSGGSGQNIGEFEADLNTGVSIGRAFIIMDESLIPLDVTLDELGTSVFLKIGPSSHDYTHSSYIGLQYTLLGHGLKPLAPVHIKARVKGNGDIVFNWIRQSRAPGVESWALANAPMLSRTEMYQVEVLSEEDVIRYSETNSSMWIYTNASQLEDFGRLHSHYTIRIAQMDPTFGLGTSSMVTVMI